MKKFAPTALAAGLVLSAAACEEGQIDPADLTTFQVTIESVSMAYDFTRSGVGINVCCDEQVGIFRYRGAI